jgi:bacteriocin-like protein
MAMENKKQNESQELSAQELANISGGIAVGEHYPGEYPTDEKYNNLSEAIANKLENIKLPYWNDNKPISVEPNEGRGD